MPPPFTLASRRTRTGAGAGSASALARATPAGRDRAVDALRVAALAVVVVAANGVCMTAFLWHLTALFAVLALAPRPVVGSPGWWMTRPLVVAATAVGTAGLVAVFRSVERQPPLPPRSTAAAAVGVAAASAGLLAVSATGAVGMLSGHSARLAGVPVTLPLAAALLAGGCLLLGVAGRGRNEPCGRTTPTPSAGS